MNTKLFFLIGLLSVLATVYGSDYSFKDDTMNKCVEESDKLCEGSSAANEGDCELYQGLLNISMRVEVNLTIEQQTNLTEFIEKCRTEVFAVDTYTYEEKFIYFSTYLSEFSQTNAEIYEIIQFENITTTFFSLYYVEQVTVIKQQTLIQKTITLDSSKNCALFQGLLEAAEAVGPDCKADVQDMIDTKLIQIIEDSSLTFEEKTIQIQQQITQIYTSYTSFEAQLSFTQITGFGCFYQFFGCVTKYEQVQQAPSLCEGDFPDILIIQYLQAQFTIYKSKDIKIALQFNQFIQAVNSSFEKITDAHERQIWYTNYVQQWLVMDFKFCSKYILTVEFGEFGSCYDFCCCDGFEGPVITTQPTVPAGETTVPAELPSSTVGVTDEVTDDIFSSTSFFTEIPSTSSSCACVCE